ncbi:MAG TPA: alpha/beta fold hydrolase, partial [Solirubrobacteraceae bacterium]
AAPFPTIVLLHGFGASKTAFESAAPETTGKKARYNSAYYAERGYAVVTPSLRGFGRSCGAADSRTPDCAKGFIHLADQRYEARDVQTLLGRLVDDGVADPGKLAVSGESYGGGLSMILALLRDRVRLPDGKFATWTSPAGRPLRIAAAAPVIPWSDLAAALLPNGRYRDTAAPSPTVGQAPAGVPIKSWLDLLFAAARATGYVAKAGSAPSADLTRWKARLDKGEPYGKDVKAILTEMYRYHSALSLPQTPAGAHSLQETPMLIATGWTDDLFPSDQALRAYTLLGGRPRLFLGNFGHPRGGNKDGTLAARNAAIENFFVCSVPAPATTCAQSLPVAAMLTQCPASAPDGPVRQFKDYAEIHPGQLRLRGLRAARTIRSDRADAGADKAFNPVGGTTDPCKAIRPARPRGQVVYATRSPGVTLMGAPALALRVRARGGPGQLVARLYDQDAKTQRERLISRGVYRLTGSEKGSIVFQLHGNGYTFNRGRTIRLELSGSDATYYRRSDKRFTVSVSRMTLQLPTLDDPDASRGITRFRALRAG